MDPQRKSIQTLTVTLDEKRETLGALYRQFGARMLEDSANPSRMAGALPEERTDAWRDLMSTRESDTAAVLEIRTAASRQQELLQFRKELEKSRIEARSVSLQEVGDFGLRVLDRFSADEDSFEFADAEFREALQKATLLRSELSTLIDKQDENQKLADGNGFFKKMFVQIKNVSVSSTIKQKKSKLDSFLAEAFLPFLKNETVVARLSPLFTDSDSRESLERVVLSVSREDDIESRAQTLNTDSAQVEEVLTSYEALENPNRRMEELRVCIRETDRRIDSLTSLASREYSDKFFDEEGKSLLGGSGDSSGFSDMGEYSLQLEQVSSYRREISIIRRRIELLETSVKIDSLNRNIASYEKSVNDYERKINQYRETIDGLSSNIHEAGQERIQLAAKREILENELSNLDPVT